MPTALRGHVSTAMRRERTGDSIYSCLRKAVGMAPGEAPDDPGLPEMRTGQSCRGAGCHAHGFAWACEAPEMRRESGDSIYFMPTQSRGMAPGDDVDRPHPASRCRCSPR